MMSFLRGEHTVRAASASVRDGIVPVRGEVDNIFPDGVLVPKMDISHPMRT